MKIEKIERLMRRGRFEDRRTVLYLTMPRETYEEVMVLPIGRLLTDVCKSVAYAYGGMEPLLKLFVEDRADTREKALVLRALLRTLRRRGTPAALATRR